MSKADFYDVVAAKHNDCTCANPHIDLSGKKSVIAVELDNPDQARESSRWIVYQGCCKQCQERLIFGNSFGGISLTGLDEIKAAAVIAAKAHRLEIDWNKVETSVK
jgi:hypothetical protein